MFDGFFEKLEEWLIEALRSVIEYVLGLTYDLFEHGINIVRDNVVETPTEFSPQIVETLRTLSDTAILPIAGLLITYAFCYEIYDMVVDSNKGGEFEAENLFKAFMKTAFTILLVTNSFDITLAFFDLGKWITDQVPESALVLPAEITENMQNEVNAIGPAIGMVGLTILVLIVTFVMTGIIYLVAWSRIITILLFISVAPLPFSTLFYKDWIANIGQNYIKQLIALMLQGFFMLVCLVVYAGLLNKTTELMLAESRPIFGLLLLLVSMGILTITLTRTHALAKSVVGVN